MITQVRLGQAFRTGCCLALLACAGGGEEAVGGREPEPAESGLLTLDLETLEVTQPVGGRDAEAAAWKLVQIEVAEVDNPSRLRLTFEVLHRTASGEEELLGTFALYPVHNPGTFLVPTSGKLGADGSVVVRMEVLDETAEDDALRVVLRPIAFRVE